MPSDAALQADTYDAPFDGDDAMEPDMEHGGVRELAPVLQFPDHPPRRGGATHEPSSAHATEKGIGDTRDSLSKLIRTVGNHTLLTCEEERALSERSFGGDIEARNELVLRNGRLVISFANRFARGNRQLFEELIQEGELGLIKAAEKYDWRKGSRFSNFALYQIRVHAIDYLRRHGFIVKTATTREKCKVSDNYTSVIGELTRKLGRDPTRAEMIKAFGTDEDSFDAVHASRSGGYVSLDTPSDEDDAPLSNFVSADEALRPDVVAMDRSLALRRRELVKYAISFLPQRGQEIIELRFLVDDPLSLEEIGQRFGLTRERIRQLEEWALAKIRRILQEHKEELAC